MIYGNSPSSSLILWTVFPPQSYDDGDAQLDSAELLKFIQQNESVAELQSYADQESNKLLRSVEGRGGLASFCLAVCLRQWLTFPWYSVSPRLRGNVWKSTSRVRPALLFLGVLSYLTGANRGPRIWPSVWRDPHPEHTNEVWQKKRKHFAATDSASHT